MGHIDIWNYNDEKWVALEDVALYDTINCQLCNEPTLATDIIIPAVIKDGILTAGAWQCRKCKAVNG